MKPSPLPAFRFSWNSSPPKDAPVARPPMPFLKNSTTPSPSPEPTSSSSANTSITGIVADGTKQIPGGNWNAVRQAIQELLPHRKLTLQVDARTAGNKALVQIAIPPAVDFPKSDLYYVLAADHAESQVLRGENAGRRLTHVAVAYALRKFGVLSSQTAFQTQFQIPLRPGAAPGSTRLIVFAQESGQRHILGSAECRL